MEVLRWFTAAWGRFCGQNSPQVVLCAARGPMLQLGWARIGWPWGQRPGGVSASTRHSWRGRSAVCSRGASFPATGLPFDENNPDFPMTLDLHRGRNQAF